MLARGGDAAAFVLPFSIIDAFACGALLTVAGTGAAPMMARPLARSAIVAVIGLGALELWPEGSIVRESVVSAVSDTLLLIVAAAIVNGAVVGFKGRVGALLESPVARYLGKISYGIYLWHLFVPVLLYKVLRRAGVPLENYFALRLLWTMTAIALSAAMWHLVERPLSRLKAFVPYLPSHWRQRNGEMARVA